MNRAEQWGTAIRFDREGRPTLFFQPSPNHGDPEMVDGEFTFVTWAPYTPAN